MIKLNSSSNNILESSHSLKEEHINNWIINKFLMSDPKKYIDLKPMLSAQIIRMPNVAKRNLKFDIEDALILERDISRFAEEILNKNFVH